MIGAHVAVLLGFGATAIYPYLAYETLGRLVDTHAIAKDYRTVMLNYRNGINKGLYKIMSKMGISTIASYRCSKLFEAVGLHDDVVGLCFQGAVSRIGGASFEDFQQDLLNLSKRAWLARKPISQGGLLKYVHGGEYHAYNPDVIQTLQKAVRSGDYGDYMAYAELVNKTVTLEIAERQLKDFFTEGEQKNVTIDLVQRVVAEYFGLSLNDLKGKKRSEFLKSCKPE